MWERPVDLAALRERRAAFASLRKLAEDPRHEGDAPRVDEARIKALVADHRINDVKAQRLFDDAKLIAEWGVVRAKAPD